MSPAGCKPVASAVQVRLLTRGRHPSAEELLPGFRSPDTRFESGRGDHAVFASGVLGPRHGGAAVRAAQTGIVRDFKRAWEAGDIDALIGLLDPDVTGIADGGGRARTSLHPIEGAEQIVRYLLRLEGKVRHQTILERTVNGQPGLVVQEDGVTVTVAAFQVEGDRIKRIWAVRNPDKLRSWIAP